MRRRPWRLSTAAVTVTVALSAASCAVGQPPPPAPRPSIARPAARPGAVAPAPSTSPATSAELLALGQRLYDKQCAACHGSGGRGDGEAAYLLYPRPRDLVAGAFRLVSTWERVPTDEDLYQKRDAHLKAV